MAVFAVSASAAYAPPLLPICIGTEMFMALQSQQAQKFAQLQVPCPDAEEPRNRCKEAAHAQRLTWLVESRAV